MDSLDETADNLVFLLHCCNLNCIVFFALQIPSVFALLYY